MNQTDKELGYLPQKTWKERLLAFILILGVIFVTLFAVNYLKSTKPKTTRRPPEAIKGIVNAVQVKKEDVLLQVEGLGYIKPASEIVLKSETLGKIVFLNENIVPGYFLKQGDLIAKIDDSDYKTTLLQKKANYEKALADLEIEKGSQEVARKELNLARSLNILDNSSESALVLRQPYLKKALSAVKLAEAEVELAKNNLSKTSIYAPFDMIITEKYVSEGSYVSNQSQILKGSYQHEVWGEISIPYNMIKFLDIENQTKKDVLISVANDNSQTSFKGKFNKIIPEIEQNGLMAKVLVTIKDPYLVKNKPLLIGTKVKAIFSGVKLKNIHKLNNNLIRDNNKIYISDNSTLKIKDIHIVYQDENYTYVDSGITDNSLIITSTLSNAVENMPLKIVGDK